IKRLEAPALSRGAVEPLGLHGLLVLELPVLIHCAERRHGPVRVLRQLKPSDVWWDPPRDRRHAAQRPDRVARDLGRLAVRITPLPIPEREQIPQTPVNQPPRCSRLLELLAPRLARQTLVDLESRVCQLDAID